MKLVESELKVNYEYEKLKMELGGLGDLIKIVEDTIRYRVENYKGSDLEKNRTGIYRNYQPPYFKVYSKDVINRVLKEFEGSVYDVEGEDGVCVEVRRVVYSEPLIRDYEYLQDTVKLKPEDTYSRVRLNLDVRVKDEEGK